VRVKSEGLGCISPPHDFYSKVLTNESLRGISYDSFMLFYFICIFRDSLYSTRPETMYTRANRGNLRDDAEGVDLTGPRVAYLLTTYKS